MNILNPAELETFKALHPDVSQALDLWEVTVSAATWKHLLEVRQTYPTADGVKVEYDDIEVVFTVFNLKGNNYRLITRINDQTQNVRLKTLLTHAQYDKGKWKKT